MMVDTDAIMRKFFIVINIEMIMELISSELNSIYECWFFSDAQSRLNACERL